MARGCVSGVPGLRRLFRARGRGSQRPGRLPTRWYATAVSIASIKSARSFGRAASIFGANAVKTCLAPLKLTWQGSMPFPLAATAMTVRSKLYASRCVQISFSVHPIKAYLASWAARILSLKNSLSR
jgi:hypothetical protein